MDFALFRLPHSTDIQLWIGKVDTNPLPIEFNSEKKFILGKFNSGDSVYHLRPHLELKNNEIEYSQLKFHFTEVKEQLSNKNTYCATVEEAVKTMEKHTNLKKVVLTRSHVFHEKLNAIESFKNLCKAYPNAFVHLSSSEITGTWLGASPENFISLNNYEIKTVALAGTFHSNNGEANWTQKEVNEQNWVEIHIEHVLSSLNINYSKTGPETMRIGDLFHLISTYKAKQQTNFNLNQLIKELNPTPAVGGIPKIESTAFINKHELLNRDLYTGIIGPYYSNHQMELFVNLRCLQIHKTSFTQYAGAGITALSIPQNEWLETENKIAMTKNYLAITN